MAIPVSEKAEGLMAESAAKLLERLLSRGDTVAVESGRLTITPASGSPVPAEWLEQNERQLITEAARLVRVEALEYLGYSVGNYGARLAGGVNLQFRNLMDGGDRHAIFNAETRRARTTKGGKAGDPLRAGQFRVGERSAFYRFWQSTGLPFQRLSSLSRRMGNLRRLVYGGSISGGERIDAKTLRPLEITVAEIREQLSDNVNMVNNSQTSREQLVNKMQTSSVNKDSPQTQQSRDLQQNQTTGSEKHGNTAIRDHGYTGNPLSPQEQTNEEWLADYFGATD